MIYDLVGLSIGLGPGPDRFGSLIRTELGSSGEGHSCALHDTVGNAVHAAHSCLMQDEPEPGTGFSHKMSLKECSATNPDHPVDGEGFLEFQNGTNVPNWFPRRSVRHYRSSPPPAPSVPLLARFGPALDPCLQSEWHSRLLALSIFFVRALPTSPAKGMSMGRLGSPGVRKFASRTLAARRSGYCAGS